MIYQNKIIKIFLREHHSYNAPMRGIGRLITPNFGKDSQLRRESLRKQGLCRVQLSLPRAKNRALGKELFCRVSHSAKIYTRQRRLCRVSGTRQSQTLGKGPFCRVSGVTTQKSTYQKSQLQNFLFKPYVLLSDTCRSQTSSGLDVTQLD